jgi:beta-galactosidase
VKGAYDAFLASNIQCDFTTIDQLADRKLLYVPYPVAMNDPTVAALTAWVKDGGTLVCEACPGYFDGHGHAFPSQPSRGLDEVFGCREKGVAFAPNLDEYSTLAGPALRCSLYRQSLAPTTGRALATHPDGSVAIVLNTFGKGRGLLVGRMPGYAYRRWPNAPSREWFASLPGVAGQEPLLKVSSEKVIGRLWEGKSGHFLWLVNTGAENETVKARISAKALGHFMPRLLRGKGELVHRERFIEVPVPARDAVVLSLI